MKIYNQNKNKGGYYFDTTCGPNFSEFGLQFNLFRDSSLNLYNKDKANEYFSHFTSDYEINGGESKFKAEEVEVFQIN